MTHQAALIFKNDLASTATKIPVGIHTNVAVTSVVKGDNYVDINFEDPEGRKHNKRLWAPNGNYPVTKDGVTETTAQALTREEGARLAHIVKLLHIFLGEEGLAKFPALDYEPFVDRAIKELTPKLSTKKVNVKLIYDSDGMYSVFGNFPDYIEEYVENQAPKLKYSKWELENRVTHKAATPTSNTSLADALK